MLIAVTITHFLSWLPLNVANVIITTFDSDKTPLFENIEHLFILYAICHWASMSSIILNPLLYGFMNGNFRNQFRKIWTSLKNCSRLKRSDSGINQSEGLALRLSRLNSTKRNGVECSEGLVTIHEDNSPEVWSEKSFAIVHHETTQSWLLTRATITTKMTDIPNTSLWLWRGCAVRRKWAQTIQWTFVSLV